MDPSVWPQRASSASLLPSNTLYHNRFGWISTLENCGNPRGPGLNIIFRAKFILSKIAGFQKSMPEGLKMRALPAFWLFLIFYRNWLNVQD